MEPDLSHYLMTVLYDFHGHKFGCEKYVPIILTVMCHNESIHVMTDKHATKSALSQRETQLKRSMKDVSLQERDEALIRDFVGCVKTDRGHVLFAYYVGPVTRSRDDLIRQSHWRIVHKDHLPFFHTHIAKNVSQFYTLNRTDTPSTSDGKNLIIDVRYIVNKWYISHDNPETKAWLLANQYRYRNGDDYLIRKSLLTSTTQPIIKNNVIKNESVMELIANEDEYDPYEVRDDAFRRISKEEYMSMKTCPIDNTIQFGFIPFTDVSRRSYISKKIVRPAAHYVHDPGVLFDAVTIATNLTAAAKRASVNIPQENLHVIINNDITPIIDDMINNHNTQKLIHNACDEILYALMAVDHATKHPPDAIATKLSQSHI